jgi:hypothetical protein
LTIPDGGFSRPQWVPHYASITLKNLGEDTIEYRYYRDSPLQIEGGCLYGGQIGQAVQFLVNTVYNFEFRSGRVEKKNS